MPATWNNNNKSYHHGACHSGLHSLTMVFKKHRRSSREAPSNTGAAREMRRHLKGILKNNDGGESSQGSSYRYCDSSTSRDQSMTKSAGSRSIGSSSASGRSRLSDSSSGGCVATTSASSAGSGAGSKYSGRASASEQSVKSPRPDRNVRFSKIHIRDYERVVGDNPSCSTGPPVAIGWAYRDARVLDLNYYEEARPYRSKTLGMVLTREEREAILLHWGVSFNEIIDSIRTNIKVKNQRRQTVTNLGKVQRLEEAFESASRKLKRALLLKRRTGDKAEELRQQADTAATALSSLKIADDYALSQIRTSQMPEEVEPDADNLENLHVAVQVSESDFCRNSPEKAKHLQRTPSSIVEDDQVSCMSGFTLGNSETASVLEMEKFHRELELEMFGDMELPSMVGQTLEVPGVEIPEEDRVYHDPPSVCGLQEPPSFYSAISQIDESKEYVYSRLAPTGNMKDHSGIIYNQSEPARIPVSFESKEEIPANVGSSMLRRSMEQEDEFPSIQRRFGHPVSVGPPAELYHHVPHHGAYYVPGDHPPANYARLSSTLDSAQEHASHPMVGGDHQICQPPCGQSSNAFATSPNYPLAAPDGSSHQRDRSSQQRQPRSRCRAASDGPEIRYVPPPTHLSPTQWMEGSSGGPSFHRAYEPVTITEDAYERDTRCYIDIGFDTYRPPTQFPPSFY